MNDQVNDKTIAKNTLFMYFRMILTACVSLYTSRIVLAKLGFDDYGLYNVIGGIIAMFGFINNAMTNVTSRFLTFYLAENNLTKLNHIFCTAFIIHTAIAVLIFFIGETVGLWYLENKMIIPETRRYAAHIIYQLSILSAILTIVSVPLTSEIIAHEKMSVYAGLSILNAGFMLVVVGIISISECDKLILYGTLLFLVQIITTLINFVYCKLKFKESAFHLYIEKKMLNEMFSFAGWSMMGNFAFLFYTQGINLLLNLFCGPIVNAARGIAIQIESTMKQFAANVQTAINPQIIKSYSQNNLPRMYSLIIASSKYCFFLIFLMSIPLILEVEFILKLWLVNYPEHTEAFVRLTLVGIMLDTLINPMFTANLATGKIKIYQARLCTLSFSLMPVAYIIIKLTHIPESLFILTLIMNTIGIVIRMFILKKHIGMHINYYIKKVLLYIGRVTFISIPIPLFIHFNMHEGLSRFIFVSIIAAVIITLSIFSVGLEKEERDIVIKKGKETILKRFFYR